MKSTILGHDVIKTITGVSTIKCSLFHGGEGEEQTRKLDTLLDISVLGTMLDFLEMDGCLWKLQSNQK